MAVASPLTVLLPQLSKLPDGERPPSSVFFPECGSLCHPSVGTLEVLTNTACVLMFDFYGQRLGFSCLCE